MFVLGFLLGAAFGVCVGVAILLQFTHCNDVEELTRKVRGDE